MRDSIPQHYFGSLGSLGPVRSFSQCGHRQIIDRAIGKTPASLYQVITVQGVPIPILFLNMEIASKRRFSFFIGANVPKEAARPQPAVKKVYPRLRLPFPSITDSRYYSLHAHNANEQSPETERALL
jgi:hypothetical protein